MPESHSGRKKAAAQFFKNLNLSSSALDACSWSPDLVLITFEDISIISQKFAFDFVIPASTFAWAGSRDQTGCMSF